MRIVFEHWKYIIKNVLFVLPMAIVPAIFLALSFDFEGIHAFFISFFSGGKPSFYEVFSAWSIIQFLFELKTVYAIFALLSIVVFLTCLLIFVEKHMRIGKRTLSGVASQFFSQLLPVCGIVLFYFALYEVWAVVLSAMLYTVSTMGASAVASVFFFLIVLVFIGVLLYLSSIFYLWLPCMQITGMKAYHALLYSYRLMTGVRKELLLSMLITFMPLFLILWACAFLPTAVAVILAFLGFTVAFLNFAVRMHTFYFYTDKIDREDLLLSYKEL